MKNLSVFQSSIHIIKKDRLFLFLVASLFLLLIPPAACSNETSNELLDWEIEKLETELEANPGDTDTRISLALLYQDAGKFKKAESELLDILEYEETDCDALFALGYIYIENDEYKKAVNPLLKIVDINKDNPMRFVNRQLEATYYYLGTAYLNMGKYQDAVDSLDQALLIDKTDADAWYLLGNTYYEQGAYTESIDSYREALRFVPEFKEVYMGMAECYEKSGETRLVLYANAMVDYCSGLTDKAIEQLEKINTGDYDYAEVYMGLGLAYEKKGELQKALGAYEYALKLQPDLWLAEMKVKALGSR